ncbi:glycosyltransferase family 2 protein [Ornithinimicrobium cryptoxanthini]|uniref:Glucosyl-3-phosphoglycerate synthase n=1 Tax=Ornithinimicrobium cryptoxanthini TaxID=2934161 RepID=A0ABY4YIN5_9MICO|nr:glycosyltransferase family 2 protein [Ornithinimicrobium cryptoxanthini]USQ76474.1 glycosyltransferase family 2 protein [Ornithinimicrobium cryptoxanthini]
MPPGTDSGAAPDRQGPGRPPARVAAIVPAKDEEDRLGATLDALAQIGSIDLVVVVDDGSTDGTLRIANLAGVQTVKHQVNLGKAQAMTSGAKVVALLEAEAGGAFQTDNPRALLFVDADLEDSARNLDVLCGPVVSGEADMAIATLPPQKTTGGGFGFVVRLARDGIARLTGREMGQPLSGMRCITREAFESALPLAKGWGVEVGLTVDVLRGGGRVVEVPVELHHRVTGRDLRSQLHRARQYRDVRRALRARSR